MSGWPTQTVGSLLADERGISVGVMYPGENTPDGVPLIRVGDVTEAGINAQPDYRISFETHHEYRRTALLGGECLITLVGRPGLSVVVPTEMAGWNAARALAVVRLRNPEDARYLTYALSAPSVQNTIKNWCNTTVQATLNLKEIRALPVPWPEQRIRETIAATIGSFADKIVLNRRMSETLEAMAQVIFRDWFVDFGPVRRKMAGATDPVAIMGGLTPDPIRAAELAALFPDALGDDDLPAGWSERPIGELVDIAGGSTPSTTDESLWQPAEHRWTTPKDLSNMSDLALFETGRRISSAGLAKITSGLLPVGTVLLSSRAPIGYLAIAQAPVAINQGFIALKPTKDFGSAYLYLWCKANMEAILANANGSTFQEISKKNFRPITSAVPGECSLCRAFGEIAEPMFARIVSAAAETRTLAETRDYLLPRLMSGEVRVGDAPLEIAA